jgi:putative FmdB family regulatory protein
MPIYEYKCPKCGMKFELLRSMDSSDADISCPKCGADKPEKLFSSFSSSSDKSSSCESGVCPTCNL